ncbi:hypothetical protein OQA88_1992 [Cercophora sp. LCS_1]
MDKLLQRVRMAERQVARRAKKTELKEKQLDRLELRRRVNAARKQAGRQLGAAIKARHEDWKLGPLAPRRDASKVDQDGNYWGSISADHASLQFTITKEQKDARSAWCGGSNFLCLAKGDRVVVLDGPFRGRITKIENIDKEHMTVDLGQDVVVNQTIPDYMRPDEMDPVEPYNAPIPISSIRLVYPLLDPSTGALRDVIVRKIEPKGIIKDRATRKVHFKRVVPGENIEIPWPKIERTVYPENEIDTKRADLDERTFVPTLLRPPMPEGVINELRNQFGKFRTRHTPEYIAKVEEKEAAKKARKDSVKTMLLPVQELNRKLREERRALGQPELTPEMLAKIGQVIAQNQERRASGKTIAGLEGAVAQMSIGSEGSKGDQPRA